jgi:3-oxoacyl-[acyl-carrier-protein] synthase II
METKKAKNNRRVVVTGLGVVSSIGIGWQEFWKNLLAGKSGISRISAFDTSRYNRYYAGEVKNFKPENNISKQKITKMGRASQMAIVASNLALRDGGISLNYFPFEKIGVFVGTTMGEPQIMEKFNEMSITKGQKDVDPLSALTYPANSISANIAMYFKFKGPNLVIANACAAGNFALGRAFDLISQNKGDLMLAGGVDAFSRIAYTGFARLYTVASERCQPFDLNRLGMIPGEGAGFLLLESLEHANKRGATIYAEMLGYGLSCDAKHMTIPSADGLEKSLRKSLLNSGIESKRIDYINAHGTGTRENDKVECEAYRKVFGDDIKKISISSNKSMLGHTLGAASALEAISCCLSVKYNKIPPTINFEKKDPECDIDCVPNVCRETTVTIALNNSLAFGGNNASVILKKINQ